MPNTQLGEFDADSCFIFKPISIGFILGGEKNQMRAGTSSFLKTPQGFLISIQVLACIYLHLNNDLKIKIQFSCWFSFYQFHHIWKEHVITAKRRASKIFTDTYRKRNEKITHKSTRCWTFAHLGEESILRIKVSAVGIRDRDTIWSFQFAH